MAHDMNRGELHLIEDDLKDDFEAYVTGGIKDIEGYLAKHLGFLAYLAGREDKGSNSDGANQKPNIQDYPLTSDIDIKIQ